MERFWIAELHASENTIAKLAGKHGLDFDDVRASIVCQVGLTGLWDDDPDLGRRLIIDAVIHGLPHYVVLYPVEHPLGDVWRLASAYRV